MPLERVRRKADPTLYLGDFPDSLPQDRRNAIPGAWRRPPGAGLEVPGAHPASGHGRRRQLLGDFRQLHHFGKTERRLDVYKRQPLSNPIENVDLPRQPRQRFTVSCNAALKWTSAREEVFLSCQRSRPLCLRALCPALLAGFLYAQPGRRVLPEQLPGPVSYTHLSRPAS